MSDIKGKVLSKKLNKNLIDKLKEKFENCIDMSSRELAKTCNFKIQLMYFNNLVNVEIIDENILKPICTNLNSFKTEQDLEKYINSGLLYHTEILKETDLDMICEKLYDGNLALVCEEFAYIFDVKQFEKRSIGDSSTEASVKSARDSFIEVASTNLSLVRRRIKSNNFKTEEYSVGNDSKTNVFIVYMEGQVNSEVLDNVRERVKKIDVMALTSPAMFEENVSDRPRSILPQLQYTERPDKFCSCIIEGKVGIFVDGIPIGYVAPALFNMLMQDSEEYSIGSVMASIKRVIRYISIIISLVLSGFYVALTTFHAEMLPPKLIMSIVRSKQDVPFQTYTEVIIMLIAFEMILEAGARLPKNIGQTISIIGGLIIGDAAVQAKLVSPAVVVVVAVVGVCGFIIPNQDLTNAVRICRFLLVILASLAGFYGLSFGIAMVILYLASFESFGYPYMKPFVAGKFEQMSKDTYFRDSLYKKSKTWW